MDLHLLLKDSLWIPSHDFLTAHSLGVALSKTTYWLKWPQFLPYSHSQNVEEKFSVQYNRCNPIDVCFCDVGVLDLLGCHTSQEQRQRFLCTAKMQRFNNTGCFLFYNLLFYLLSRSNGQYSAVKWFERRLLLHISFPNA